MQILKVGLRCLLFLLGCITPFLFAPIGLLLFLPFIAALNYLSSISPEYLNPKYIKAIPYAGAFCFLMALPVNAFLLKFSAQKSLGKFSLLCLQTIPIIAFSIFCTFWVWCEGDAKDCADTYDYADPLIRGIYDLLECGFVTLNIVLGAYWGMSNPIARWIDVFKARGQTQVESQPPVLP